MAVRCDVLRSHLNDEFVAICETKLVAIVVAADVMPYARQTLPYGPQPNQNAVVEWTPCSLAVNPAAIVTFVEARSWAPMIRRGLNLVNVHPSLPTQIFRHFVKV